MISILLKIFPHGATAGEIVNQKKARTDWVGVAYQVHRTVLVGCWVRARDRGPALN